MNYSKIIKSVSITEKVNDLVERENKYTFQVSKDSTKGQIKEAVEGLYGVSVVSVRVLNNPGKLKRSLVNRRKQYRKKDKKKAIVELAPKDSIKLFEGGK